ncbi:MAG: HNH endonuclease [Acidobacteriota bacterium]|nr:HNH endonuclease [Acidobacteriota bacterium]
MISTETRQIVRRRANFACEFCDITETDVGGELTVDHFQPKSRKGSDNLENLIYACARCNLYKADYFPKTDAEQKLWNPRQESSDAHFLHLPSGELFALSETGKFTIYRLRLNRPQLIENRRQKQIQAEEDLLLARYQSLTELLMRMYQQHLELLDEQRNLLEEQQRLLRIFNSEN